VIILDAPQGGPEWLAARLGVCTASDFDKIITPAGKSSSQAPEYMGTLAGEWLEGASEPFYENEWMRRGTFLEPEARALYEFTEDVEVNQVGLVYLNEDRAVSCSPDGLLDEGGLEIKCPKLGNHIASWKADAMPPKYKAQVQGNIWICERDWWDFVSYHPSAPPLIKRIYRDDKFIKALASLIEHFIVDLEEMKEKLEETIL